MKTRCINLKDYQVRGFLDGSITDLWVPVKPQPYPHHWEMLEGYQFAAMLMDTVGGPDVRFSHQLPGREDGVQWVRCHLGQPGDVLIGREVYTYWYDPDDLDATPDRPYRELPEGKKLGGYLIWEEDGHIDEWVDEDGFRAENKDGSSKSFWKSTATMPAWAARIRREIVSVEVRQVQSVTEVEAKAAGSITGTYRPVVDPMGLASNYRTAFMEKIGPEAWERNDWFWHLTTKEAK